MNGKEDNVEEAKRLETEGAYNKLKILNPNTCNGIKCK